MERLLDCDCEPSQISPLTLAFVGDGVYDLMVREKLVCTANRAVGVLNNEKVKMVCCQAQSELYKRIEPLLTDEELAVYKRGRNAHTSHTPKNASVADYHSATGFEALLGYIYLKGDLERLKSLFNIMTEENF
ncbi:MAG TPA: ribonuclease III [Clostridiales bacterium]|nr:ribonuclease III [Clostridiales bacterium]